ncbi:MAG TPA: metalloregulator ArsR/SmtB family transcription factor [Chloroflexota bacterium]|jgi:ArsR family transcriptional regulator
MPFNQPLQRFKAEFFKALAHPVRITILELLRQGELTVGDLQERLVIDPSSVSQQLAVLRSRNIVESRRAGSNVFYTVRDPAIFGLLDTARTIFDNHLIDMQEMAAPDRGEADVVDQSTPLADERPASG